MKERQGSVYVLHNLVDDKEYVGQTIKQPASLRWDGHLYLAFVKKDRRPLYCAMRRDGLESFTAEVIWVGPESKLNTAERRFIRQRKTFGDSGWGYNLTTGGDHFKLSKRSIRKMRNTKRAQAAEQPGRFAYLVSLMQAANQTPAAREKRTAALSAYAEMRRKAGKPHFSRRTMELLRVAANRPRGISDLTHEHISAGQKRRWAEGRGSVPTAGTRSKHSVNAKRQWRRMRAKMLAAIKVSVNAPDYRRMRSEIQKKRWLEKRAELCAGLRRGHNTSKARANHSKAAYKAWLTRRTNLRGA